MIKLSYYTHGNLMFSEGYLSSNNGCWIIKPKLGYRKIQFWNMLKKLHT